MTSLTNIEPIDAHHDALGNLIVIGQLYGYTTVSSGKRGSSVGEAVNLTKSGVSLLLKTRRYQSRRSLISHKFDKNKIVNLSGISSFPVDARLIE